LLLLGRSSENRLLAVLFTDRRDELVRMISVRYAAGSNIVVLEPDVAAVFPNAASVNEALRSLASVMAGRTPKPPTWRCSA